MTTAVFEEHKSNGIAFAGFGVGVFVRAQFLREFKSALPFWFGPVLRSVLLMVSRLPYHAASCTT
jgi:hypothetical protein